MLHTARFYAGWGFSDIDAYTLIDKINRVEDYLRMNGTNFYKNGRYISCDIKNSVVILKHQHHEANEMAQIRIRSKHDISKLVDKILKIAPHLSIEPVTLAHTNLVTN